MSKTVEQLLKYQEIDSELLQIERDAANSEERRNFVQAKNFLTKAPEKLDALDARARELNEMLQEIKNKIAEITETLHEFENVDELIEGGADVSFYIKSVTQLMESVKALKSKISAMTKEIKEDDGEYRNLKKKTIAVQKQYQDAAAVYQKYKDEKRAEMAEIQKKLSEIAKDIDPETMRKYQAKRSERIFPIVCAVRNNRCSKCGSELTIVAKERVSQGQPTECDNCHRFLYKE